jgi:hypothetical protein
MQGDGQRVTLGPGVNLLIATAHAHCQQTCQQECRLVICPHRIDTLKVCDSGGKGGA